MAQTTVQLGHLIARTNFKLFDFDYKFDDKKFKEELEKHVTDFYWFYEIGQETPDRFKHSFKRKWLRIISYYNDLYNTTLLSYNPLTTHNMTERLEQLNTSLNEQDSNSTTTGRGQATFNSLSESEGNTKVSDYPQQPIAGGDFLAGENVTDGTTNTQTDSVNTDSTTATGKVSGKTTNNSQYEKTIEGMTGTTYQELISKQRDILIRIPDMVIDEMKTCFMLTF